MRALCSALDLTASARDALLLSARAAAPAPAEDPGADSLPLPLTTLVGREADVQTLQGWLANPAIRLITITGPGGVGKTRLALELAHGHASEVYPLVFVPLAATRTAVFVASAIAEALGLSSVTATELPKRARAALEHRPTLLVLDNFEQVLEAAPLVAELLSSAGSLRVLATSRATLHLRGEREYLVSTLALEPTRTPWKPPIWRDARRYSCSSIACDVQADFRLTSANASRSLPLPAARRITACHRARGAVDEGVDGRGTPSASEPRRTTRPRDAARRSGAASHHERDRRVELRAPRSDERRAFRHFGALPGLFPIEAAAAVLAGPEAAANEMAALRAAAALIDKSLLVRAPTAAVPTCPVYQMLECVRVRDTRVDGCG